MTLGEIEDAYGEQLEPLPALRREMAERLALAERQPPRDKEARKKFRDGKKVNTDRLKELKAAVKVLTKLEAEAEERRAAARQHAEREIALARETADDLARICSDPVEARRYFALIEREEIEENEFNLNLPRYVDTFEPEEKIEITDALKELEAAEAALSVKTAALRALLVGKPIGATQ
jgi:type I restriction enzyme M protein